MGENYVLGNRDDCNEFKPYKLDPRMFETNQVQMMACGTMHAVALTTAGPESHMPVLDEAKLAASTVEVPEQKTKQKSAKSEKAVPVKNGSAAAVQEAPKEEVEQIIQPESIEVQASASKVSSTKKRTHDEMMSESQNQ